MSKYQRPQVFPGDFDAVRAGHRTFKILHGGAPEPSDQLVDCGGNVTFSESYPVGWVEPKLHAPRWFCSDCPAAWTDKRVKEIAVQDPGGTFWRQEVAGV